jgi:predicted CopG family antitoxin
MKNTNHTTSRRCSVLLNEEVYERLKTRGRFGESFSDLLSRLLDALEERER